MQVSPTIDQTMEGEQSITKVYPLCWCYPHANLPQEWIDGKIIFSLPSFIREVINLIVDEISLARVIGGFLSCPRSPTLPTWRSKYLWWQRTILTTINHATTRLIVLSVGCFCFKKFNILTHLTRLMHSHVFCIGICLTEVTWRAPSKYKSIS